MGNALWFLYKGFGSVISPPLEVVFNELKFWQYEQATMHHTRLMRAALSGNQLEQLVREPP